MNSLTKPAAVEIILPPFDYRLLSPAASTLARAAVEYIGERRRSTTVAILEIGQKLNEVKESLDHGQFSGWLEAEFGWSDRSAQNYMMAARTLGTKTETVADFPVTTIYALARASDTVREKVLERIAAAPMPMGAVRELISDEKEAERAAEARKSPEQSRKDKVKHDRELRKRERNRQERDQRRAAEDSVNSRVAVMIVERFGTELPRLIEAVDESTFYDLTQWLKYPYGFDVVGFQTVARKKPEA